MIIDLVAVLPLIDDAYRAFVRNRPCCGCGVEPAGDAHHRISDRFAAMRVTDYHTMPLCRSCHERLHADWRLWEEMHGPQWRHVAQTLTEAIRLGVLAVNAKLARVV